MASKIVKKFTENEVKAIAHSVAAATLNKVVDSILQSGAEPSAEIGKILMYAGESAVKNTNDMRNAVTEGGFDEERSKELQEYVNGALQ